MGDSLAVSSGSRAFTLRLGALVDFQKLAPLASRKIALMDIAQAQALLGERGRIHQIDLVLAAGRDSGARPGAPRRGPGARRAGGHARATARRRGRACWRPSA